MKHAFIVTICACALLPRASPCYELITHGLLTYRAYAQSKLQPGAPLRKDLGIEVYLADPLALDSPLGDRYFDFSGTDARPRQADAPGADGKPFDRAKMVASRRDDNTIEFSPKDDNLRLPGWLLRGAIREDDYTAILGLFKKPDNPQDDPFRNLDRPLNHFYDPVNDSTVFLGFGARAPWWGVGVVDPFADPVEEDAHRTNHFTIYDAREAMYRALTGHANTGQVVAPTQADRKAYWATTFRALGDVVHLIQDMAQPQHTRNDKHNGLGDSFFLEAAMSGHESVFEHYMDARATGRTFFKVDVGLTDKPVQIGTPRPLNLSGYDIPRFNRYSDYFSTARLAGVGSGVGIADYSNRGFFSAGRNFNDTTYALPSRNVADYKIVAVAPVAWDGAPIDSVAPVYLYNGTVSDTVSPQLSASGVPLTSYGVWDQFLEARGARPRYSLNYLNYDAAADLLLPRAVAYSAGLIDYFFRGQMEISLPDEGVYGVIDHAVENQAGSSGFRKLKLKLRNTTPPVIPSGGVSKGQGIQQNMAGSLVAVVKYHENTCYKPDLTGEFGSQEIRSALGDGEFSEPPAGCRGLEERITVSDPKKDVTLDAGVDATLFVFDFAAPVPIDAVDVYLQVVFRGVLGSEQDAVVVVTKDISEPTHFTLLNVTDYLVCYNDTWYYKNEDGTLPTAIPQQFASVFQAQPYSAARFAFGTNAGAVAAGSLTKPLVVVENLAPGEFVRFAILTEPGVVYNDEIAGYYSPVPPPYKLHVPETNQITVLGSDLPEDPYSLSEAWAPIEKFRKTRGYGSPSFGYRWAGTGDCYVRPTPAPPTPPWKPLPQEPEPAYALVPSIRPVVVNFN